MLNGINSKGSPEGSPKGLNFQTGVQNLNKLNNTSNSPTKKIVLASKGDASYILQMDLDQDGILTLDEFNQYCSENQISEEDKLKLLATMQSAKNTSDIMEKSKKLKKEDSEKDQAEDKSIYARKGERKYDERMDENNDAKVTYKEYEKYCEEHLKNKDQNNDEDKAESTEPSLSKAEKDMIRAYSETEIEENESEIQVEVEA